MTQKEALVLQTTVGNVRIRETRGSSWAEVSFAALSNEQSRRTFVRVLDFVLSIRAGNIEDGTEFF